MGEVVGGWLKNWQEIFIFLYFSGLKSKVYISGATATAAAEEENKR